MSVSQSSPDRTTGRMDNTPIEVPRGLANVIVTETQLGDVRGHEGFYHYRQYSAVDLARQASLEEVWHLMIMGQLPSADELAEFKVTIAAHQEAPASVRELLPLLARLSPTDLLGALRGALSATGAAWGCAPLIDLAAKERIEALIGLAAVTPSLVASLFRLQQDLEPIAPSDDLGFVANYLYQLTGVKPAADIVSALNSYLIATIDHGFNASTFTARVIASTGADPAACVVGALGALSGPLHGGAPSRALDALDQIKTPDRIEPWVRERIQSGRRMMGFGHPIYRTEDPRSAMLKEVAMSFGGPRVEFAVAVERAVVDLLAELKPGRALHTNVEFYAGIVMERCGIDPRLFTPTFAVARMIGWTAHILEQAADSKIIRPSARYVGPPPPQPVPAPAN